MIESLRDRKKLFIVMLMFLNIIFAIGFWISYLKDSIMMMTIFTIMLMATVIGMGSIWKKQTNQF
jgi:hypothetical protein